MLSVLKKLFGSANDRNVKKFQFEIDQINALTPSIESLSDEELKNKTVEFKQRLAAGATVDSLTYEAFAVVREAAKRVHSTRHFDVQLIGGLILHRGMIAEMRTGEGKTLVSTLPVYLNALTGKGVHVVTVNDYLATRDSESMSQIYNFLGLSVGCIVANMSDDARRKSYMSDITYATNNELGFDFLKDNMKYSEDSKVQRLLNFAVIDEVDSILIDEARTPLIISGPVDDNSELYSKIDNLIRQLHQDDFEKDEKLRTVNLTESGINKMEMLLTQYNIIQTGFSLYDFENLSLVHYVNQSLKAHMLFKRDVDYLVQEDKVMIIDEFTGRVMDGRRYSEGLHQALEAKERVPIQNENQTLASITFQNYFRLYNKLAGMTGTAMTEAAELKDIYNLDVISVPTHNPVARKDYDDEIYGTKEDKYNAIVKLVKDCYLRGQPVLVGTVNIEKSEEISNLLNKHDIVHNVLNAKFHEREAHIVAQAGRYRAVTIATNMAGRGTDIKLGGNLEMMIADIIDNNPLILEQERTNKINEAKTIIAHEKQQVIEAGGLYIIGTERHESRRIDNQLRGRSGRQGDHGATKFFLSLEDDLMRIFASDRISGILRTLGLKDGEAIQHPMISKSLEKAQQKVESHNFEIRKNLLNFDNVMNNQRGVIYEQRSEIISATDVSYFLEEAILPLVTEKVSVFIKPDSYREDWDIEGLKHEIYRVFSLKLEDHIVNGEVTEVEIAQSIAQMVKDLYQSKENAYSKELMRDATKYILLTTLDQIWKDHLHNLDHLKQGISLRAYGQKDPLNEYKREAFNLFEQTMHSLNEHFIQQVCYLHLDKNHTTLDAVSLEHKQLQEMTQHSDNLEFEKYNTGNSVEVSIRPTKSYVALENRITSDPNSWGKISRNESCPCGSGSKYKHCHGAQK
ncbi:MAG: preprotein translocase subunit SecA [Rickettsiaceae bacterium]|nr:MAG: preprotein translocase subunit SecA [Rickettsiaceae bacterium]